MRKNRLVRQIQGLWISQLEFLPSTILEQLLQECVKMQWLLASTRMKSAILSQWYVSMFCIGITSHYYPALSLSGCILYCSCTIYQPGFSLQCFVWSLLNGFWTGHSRCMCSDGHCECTQHQVMNLVVHTCLNKFWIDLQLLLSLKIQYLTGWKWLHLWNDIK